MHAYNHDSEEYLKILNRMKIVKLSEKSSQVLKKCEFILKILEQKTNNIEEVLK